MLHLAPGYRLYRFDESQWRYTTPDLAFHSICGPEIVLDTVSRAILDGLEHDFADGSDASLLLRQLMDRGVVAGAAEPRTATPSTPILVVGTGPVAEAIEALAPDRVTIVASVPSAGIAAQDHLVVCDSVQRDTAWRAIDAERAQCGATWHRAFMEGDTLVVGPFSSPGGVSYEDYRSRRRAAHPLVQELDRLWAHLDSTSAGAVWAPRSVCAMAAALILQDLDAYDIGARTPGSALEHTIDPDGAHRTHPVLALPESGRR